MKKICLVDRVDLSTARKKFLKNFSEMVGDRYEIDWIGRKDLPENLKKKIDQKKYLRSGLYAQGKKTIVPIVKRTIINSYHLKCYLDSEKPDFIFVTGDNLALGPSATLLGKIKKIKTIVRFPTEPYSYIEKNSPIGLKLPELYRNLVFHADKLVVLGPKTKQTLIEHGAPEDKIEIIPQPIDQNKFQPPEDEEEVKEFRKELNLPQDKKIILTIGRLTEAKGMDTLSKIIPKLTKKEKDLHFCIVGDGPYREKLQKLDQTTLPGRVPFKEIEKYYKACNLYVHPSRFETTSNVILEASACGLTTIGRKDVGDINWTAEKTFRDEDELIDMIERESLKGGYKSKLKPKFRRNRLAKKYIDLFKK